MNLTDSKEEISERLLAIESSRLLLEEDGIASITFYRGDLGKATEYFRKRAKQVLAANPWLIGRLVRNKRVDKNVHLVYPQDALSEELFESLFHPNPEELKIGSEMPYQELYRESHTAVIKKGIKSINKPDVVSRITIVPDMDCKQDGFALIFSISHIAADGYTYYKIFNSLFTNNPVEVLQPKRYRQADEKIAEAVGKQEYDYLFSAPFILNAITGGLFGKKAKCYAFYVEPDKVKEAKFKSSSQSNVGFVSTNDILTSNFIRTIKARLCMTAINLRNRVDSIGSHNAGNYEAALLFDDATSETPEGIRRTLLNGVPFQPTTKRLPSFWEGLTCNIGLVTNWAGFTGNLEIEGCKQRLHMPLHATKLMPFDCAIIFAPTPGKLAVLFFAKKVDAETLVSGCELGDSVSTKIFQ